MTFWLDANYQVVEIHSNIIFIPKFLCQIRNMSEVFHLSGELQIKGE